MKLPDLIRHSRAHKIFKPFFAGRGHVLVFHRVCRDSDSIFNKNLQVTPEYLENVLKYFISNKIEIVSLDECYELITSKIKKKRFAVFTFDDGYADLMSQALPVFEKYNAPFALFQTTGYPDQKLVNWVYLLEDLVSKNKRIEFNADGREYFFNARTGDEKIDAYFKLRTYLRTSDKHNLPARLTAIFKSSYQELIDYTKRLMLSWEQISEFSNHSLITIGSHSVNHKAFSELQEKEVINEINESIEIIERKIGKPVLYLAYPFGGHSQANVREFNLARDMGIKMAFTAINGNIFKSHADHLTSLPRIGLNENWSSSLIDLYVNGFTPFIDKFR